MRHLFLSFTFLCSITISYGQDPLRGKLDGSYLAFTGALAAKDGEKLKNSLSSYSYITMKNQVTSAGEKFPDYVYQMAPMMIMDLKKLKFLKAIENGPTANSIYYGKGPMGDNAVIIIKYVKENNQWKFDRVEEKSDDEYDKKMKAKDLSFLNNKEFKPSGVMQVAPKEVAAGEYKGMVDVMSYGYKSEIFINGAEQKGSDGGSSSSMVMGGLKKGTNIIEIKVTPLAGKDPGTLRVTVRALVDGEEKDVFTLEEKSPASSIKKEFEMK